MRLTPALVAVLAATALSLAACDQFFTPKRSPFQGVDVTGGNMGGELRLMGHDGKAHTLAEFRGKVVVVSFGYTHCPDVCPTTLSDLAASMKLLGDDARRVQVLFVTVDPKRDTQELLSQYVPAFYPGFLGLYGDAAATAKVSQDFHVYAHERPEKDGSGYTVDHSAHIYVIDREGRLRLLLPPGAVPAAIASDLRLLLNS